MRTAKLTLKNYRSFGDTHPVSIDIGPGFTALVGPNNSGKSSFLKFLHEYTNLWSVLGTPGNRQQWVGSKEAPQAVGVRDVVDQAELINDITGRPIVVEIEFPVAADAENAFRKVILRSTPTNPSAFTAQFYYGPRMTPAEAFSGITIINASSSLNTPIDFSALDELCASLHRAMYVGPFRNAINTGAANYYGLQVGTSFITLWNQWQTGTSRANRLTIAKVTNDIARLFGYESLHIHASEDRTSLLVDVDGRPYQLRDLGAGLAQFIILFGNVAVARPSMLLIDEPELNLHPSLQIDFLTSLASYTTSHSVLFATHSIGLARSTAERIYLLQRRDQVSIASPLESTSNLAEFLGEMSFSTSHALGYDTVLLVEGPTEVKAIQQFLRSLKIDQRVVLLQLGGSSMINRDRAHELSEVKRLSDKVAVLIDSERTNAGAPLSAQRREFLRTCEELGFNVHATDFRALENYLPTTAVRAVKGPQYRALEPYEALSDIPLGWSRSDNWRIAREVTKAELLDSDLGKFLDAL